MMKTQYFAISGLALGLFAAGCVSVPEARLRDPYAAAAYTGAEQLYQVDKVAGLTAPAQRVGESGVWLEPVVYAGIEGARRAHLAYAEDTAEKLDGRCERFVAVAANESLVDIAQLCDVPVSTLVDYNPAVANPYYLSPGQVVEIPGGTQAPAGGAFSMADALVNLYTVREGDSLSQIAYRFNVSRDAVAILNPDVSWAPLQPGRKVLIPAAGVQAASSAAAPAAWQGYAGAVDADASGLIGSGDDLAPYQLTPVKTAAIGEPSKAQPTIGVDKIIVEAGKSVKVTVDGLPAGTPVTLYRGDNLQNMQAVGAMRAGDDGQASKSVRLPRKKSDMGGVVFKATRDDTGESLYSKRVGVIPRDVADKDEPEDAEND